MLHFPPLVLVLLFTLACILLLEVAARSLPLSFTKEITVSSTISPAGSTSGNSYHKRQTSALQVLQTLTGDTYGSLDNTQIITVSSEFTIRNRERGTDI